MALYRNTMGVTLSWCDSADRIDSNIVFAPPEYKFYPMEPYGGDSRF